MKSLVPMVAALALCGAGVAALLVGNASADTPRRPVMIAMVTSQGLLPGSSAAAPPTEGGGPQGLRQPSGAEIAARHKLMCQDAYAHQVGELAYLEAKLNLTATQQPLFDRWKSIKLDIAKRDEAGCSTGELPIRTARPTPMDSMAREEDLLKRRLADLEVEQPALSSLYNSLNASQKDALTNPGDMPMMGRRMLAADMGMGQRRALMRQRGPGPAPMPPGARPSAAPPPPGPPQ